MFTVEVEFWFLDRSCCLAYGYMSIYYYFTLWNVIYINIGGCGDGKYGKEKNVTPL